MKAFTEPLTVFRRTVLFLAIISLVLVCIGIIHPLNRSHAQGVSTIVGYAPPNNYLAPTAGAQMAAVGGVVTNPSGVIAQVSAGAAFCYQGGALDVPQAQITLAVSKTFLIVYNCSNQSVYAKQGVVGAGTLSPDQPGVPPSYLAATYPTEIPIATVVCGASTCGTITDARVPGQWAIGTPTGAHLVTPGSTNDTSFTVTLVANTATKTFTIPYQVAPVVVCTDQTTAQLVKAAPTTTNVVVSDTVGATDVVGCIVIANPN